MKKTFFLALVAIATGLSFSACCNTSCNNAECADSLTVSGLNPADFATDSTALYVLKNDAGMEVCFTNFGGRIVSIMVPDKDGNMQDVCLGHDNIADYVKYGAQGCNFGALIGRYGNRIAKGQFTLDGNTYQLPINNGPNSLHGGCPIAFHNRIWEANQKEDKIIEFTTTSPDGEDGYPGNLDVKVTYALTEDNTLIINYFANTDKPTVLNLTNHCYFNLNGDHQMPITNHLLQLNADCYTPVDSTYMTTGEIAPVAGTPMDFTAFKEVGKEITNFDFEQLKNGNGYDHNWVLNTKCDDTKVCATVKSPVTGIVLDVYTNEPGIQFYSGNFLDGTTTGKDGKSINQRTGMCLETQKYPDTPNKSHLEGWPSAILEPGQEYYSHCVYKFSVEK